jgi:hypothetical protein
MVQSNWPYKLMWWTGLIDLAYQPDQSGQKNYNFVNFGHQDMPPIFGKAYVSKNIALD